MDHTFIFSPGQWEGEGEIRFSMASDILKFKMHWQVFPMEQEQIAFHQEIHIQELPEKMKNHFILWKITPTNFQIQLENQIVNRVIGSGWISDTLIAWEFREKEQAFEGYEIYEKQPDGSYKMKAEFTSGAGLFTHIHGSLYPLIEKEGVVLEEEGEDVDEGGKPV